MKKLAVGLMSGTSGDGVSLALCTFNKRTFELLGYKTFPYPPALSKKILQGPSLKANEISQLNMQLGIFFADSTQKFLRQLRIATSRVSVIGSHGQTIYHGPKDDPRNTLQIGEPSFMAEQTGIPVVADFRMRDLAAGGGGAPLIPFFDRYFFGSGRLRAMQNIGGISNVAVVGRSIPLIAFDIGPGNCLIDLAVQSRTKNRLLFDGAGKIARKGKINMKAVKAMLSHPYFRKRPPKSTGRELFNGAFIPSALKKEKFENLVASLTYFTAAAITDSYRKFIKYPFSEVVVSGGGALNLTLMNHLRNLLKPVPVRPISKWGIPVQAKEPIAFAFFALKALEGKTNHSPEGTGAKRASILGKIIPGKNHATA
ncbi:MAG TPA: anhydro-N-acetylmuramic acid kinase [bacterium]|nr:anhydro-N-acetylmuramic acid kinase [bacterium]